MPFDHRSNSLEQHWMPFTDNRGFKAEPRMIVAAEGVYLTDQHGRRIIDGSSGLFCSPAGHCHPKIVEAVHAQMQTSTYVAAFGLGHPGSFALAERVARLAPEGINRVFFVNSGSEAVDTAMKIAMAYHAARGQTRTRFVSRERAYHGVNIGGVSLSGLVKNRETFQAVIPNVVMLRHTWDSDDLFIADGRPGHGVDLANDLQRICDTWGGSSIAAVFVEPVAGSTGVLPPPVGYLERLREICDAHGILLAFDEVICGFGRLGSNFGAQHYGVTPDIMTMAKALTNGSIPMGAVAVRDEIHDTVTNAAPQGAIELFHGYTYSGHPAACAAGLAAMDIFENEGLFDRARDLIPHFQAGVMALKDHPLVRDIRVAGLMAGVEIHAGAAPGQRGGALQKAMFFGGLHVKFTGDCAILAPQFVATESQIDEILEKFRASLDAQG